MYLNQNEDTNLQMVSPRQLRGKNINHKIPLSNFYLTYTIQNSDISHHSLKHHNRRACRQEKLDNQFLETQTQGTPHIHTKIFTGKLNEKNIKPPPPNWIIFQDLQMLSGIFTILSMLSVFHQVEKAGVIHLIQIQILPFTLKKCSFEWGRTSIRQSDNVLC